MKHSTKLFVIIATAVSTVAFAGVGWAYWSTSGSGSASASVGTLTAPGKAAGTVASGTVSLSWSASTVSGGGTVKYHVERRSDPGSTWTDVCGSTALAPITGAACSNAPGAGTYKYRVTAVYQSWTQVGSESDPISVVLDTTPPSVTVNQKTGQADPTKTLPILYTVTFSEPVTGFDVTDLTRTGTSTGGTVTVNGSGASYEISVSGTPTNGTLIFTVAANKAIDAAGNNNTASTSTDNTVTYDTAAPSASSFLTINKTAGTAGRAEAGDTITLTYSEAMNPTSMLPGWDGTSTNVVVKMTDGGSSSNDLLTVWDTANTNQVAVGTIDLGAKVYVTGNVSFSASTITLSVAGVVTITLGAVSDDTKVATITNKNIAIWTPSSTATDLAGNFASASTRTGNNLIQF